MRNLTIILLFLAMPVLTSAAIYKFYDENGNVVFADQPGPNAEEIEVKDVQTIKTPRIRPTTKLTDPDKDNETFTYDEFKITSPGDDQTIRANSGDLNVDISIKPQLRTKLKHKIVLLLDGKTVSEPGSATSFALHGVERGQHSLSAKVVGTNGETIISTESVTVHLKRFSIQHQNSPNTIQPVPASPAP